MGAAVRNELGADGKSLVDLLAAVHTDNRTILARMQTLAHHRDDNPKGIHEIAKRHGFDLTTVHESPAELDVLTGKPFPED
jgi:hypothetical protein